MSQYEYRKMFINKMSQYKYRKMFINKMCHNINIEKCF